MNKRELADTALKAWQAAKRAKKPEAELKTLRADYEAKLLAAEEEDALKPEPGSGKDGKDGKDGKTPEGTPPNVITLDQIKGFIGESVRAALGETQAKHVTEDALETAIAAALEKHGKKNDAGGLDVKSVKVLVDESVKALLESTRKAAAMKHPTGEDTIEVPEGWTKGNLPVFAQQLKNVMLKLPMNHGIDEAPLKKAVALGDRMFKRARLIGAKALTSTGSGTGDEWVPTDLASELMRRLYLDSLIAQKMMVSEIEMPTNPYQIPLSTTRPTFYLTAEGVAPTEGSTGTGAPTLTAVKVGARILYSYELDEDSIVPILNTVTQLLAEAGAYTLESMIINGDTTGTHQDSDTHVISGAAEKGWKGLRKLALAIAQLKADLATGGINRANLLSLIKLLKKYGKRKTDLAWIVGTAGETDMLGLDDVVTLDKAGPRATTITGTISSYFGIPIFPSEAAREDLNASGVYDGSTTTKGSIILANLGRFLLGNRKEFTIETDRDIETQQQKIVATFRKAFTPIEVPSASITSVAIGYNYTA